MYNKHAASRESSNPFLLEYQSTIDELTANTMA